MQQRLHFENLLASLSATFINLPADQVNSQIELGLRDLVEFLGIDRGGFAELVADEQRMTVTHSYHRPHVPRLPDMVLDERLPWYAGAIRSGKVLRLARLPDDLPAEALAEREYCRAVGLKSHVMIPLKMSDAVVAALGFGSFRGYCDWPDELVQRLHLVGDIFNNANARKRADQALRATETSLRQSQDGYRHLAARLLHAQEEERRHIAREMHDDWTQRLAVLGIDLAKLEKQVGANHKARLLVQGIQKNVVDLSQDMHELSRQLHPSILDDLGLVDALRSECTSFSRREGIVVQYQPGAVPQRVARNVALCIYRVAQEALRNVAKHSGATEASVTLALVGRELCLRVHDNGVGFDPAKIGARHGLGHSSMQERVRLINGIWKIASSQGQGTTVEVRAPMGNTP